MGCDIHIHAEILVGDKWLHYSLYEPTRSYRVFSKLAGVRSRWNDGGAISLPKGLPADISRVTRLNADLWGGDGHDHSWLSSGEVGLLGEWWCLDRPLGDRLEGDLCVWLGGYLFGEYWDQESCSEAPCTDFRWVFWFDN